MVPSQDFKMSSGTFEILKKSLNGFDKEALFKTVLPYVKGISETDLVNEIIRLKAKLNERNIVETLVTMIQNSNFPEKELTSMIATFQLLGIACKPQQLKWSCVRFSNESEFPYDHLDPIDFNAELKRSLLRNDVQANVMVLHMEGLYWFSVTERKLVKKCLRALSPLYFACFYGQPYVFWCKRDPSASILKSVAEVNGYESFDIVPLTGRDLKSMLDLLLLKGKVPGSTRNIPLCDAVKETTTGVDISQHHNRKKYLDDLFGPIPPKISNCLIEARNISWQGKAHVVAMSQIKLTTTLEFHSTDTVQMMKELGEEGILRIPPPTYVKNILNTGKTHIKLKAKVGNRSVQDGSI